MTFLRLTNEEGQPVLYRLEDILAFQPIGSRRWRQWPVEPGEMAETVIIWRDAHESVAVREPVSEIAHAIRAAGGALIVWVPAGP